MSESVRSARRFPVLRNLQYSPLKQGEDQYILLWDPTGLGTEKLIVPLSYFYLLQFLDGEHSLEQVAAEYLKKFGEFLVPDRLERLVADLDGKLFLEGEKVDAARRAALAAYRAAPVRKAAFAGKSYEADPGKLAAQIAGFFSSKDGPGRKDSEHKGQLIKGLVAPHYEIKDAGPIYAWAYKELQEAQAPDLFVIFGTCHAGLTNGYALTDKDFETPLGTVHTDRPILAQLRTDAGHYFDEELAHRSEHSIEFQLPFIQRAAGRAKPITIVPVLCAYPAACFADPGLHDLRERVETFLRILRDVLNASGRPACLIASAELAHIGMRYGDASPPTDFSFHRCMQQDLAMLKHAEEIDADAFARFIAKEGDSRRISGFAAIYTLLKLVGEAKGQVLRYDRGITDQFNSTVTYASMAFY
jgi:AmmeMemoRadiSam system protein B